MSTTTINRVQPLSSAQIAMLWSIYTGADGFICTKLTESSLLKRGLIETRGFLQFRLTPAGKSACESLGGHSGQSKP
jgi:hypothetical protein